MGSAACEGVSGEACTRREPHISAPGNSVEVMDNQAEVREFLVSRRAKVTPEAVGLPAGPNRRVPGLRRTEVAVLAGVSVEYYSKLERGAIAGASSSVLDAIASALQLNDTERVHLFDLARSADGIPLSGRPRRRTMKPVASRESLQWVLNSITEGIAFVRDQHQDLLATNDLGRAFYSPLIGDGGRTPNLARFQFLDPASRDFYPDWDLFSEMCVAIKASMTWSESCLLAAMSSGGCGVRMTCVATAPEPNASIIPSLVKSHSPTKNCTSPPTPVLC
jgi:transcriptional regulator with XRE-family HTH domain